MNDPDAVYSAESAIDEGHVFTTLDQVQEYLDAMTARDWWSERFPGLIRIEAVPIRSRSCLAVGRAEASRAAGVVGLTPAGRRETTVLHEVAHSACRAEEGHGPLWASTYLELVYRMRGAAAWECLRKAFAARGIETCHQD